MNRYSYSDLQTFVAVAYKSQPFFMRPFAYPVEFLGATAGSTNTRFLTVQANGDFTVTEIAGVVTSAAFAPLAAIGVIQIVDTGSNEKWTNDFAPLMNYSRDGFTTDPYYLAFPRFLGGNTQLQINFRNDGPATVNLYLAFRGVSSKVYSQ